MSDKCSHEWIKCTGERYNDYVCIKCEKNLDAESVLEIASLTAALLTKQEQWDAYAAEWQAEDNRLSNLVVRLDSALQTATEALEKIGFMTCCDYNENEYVVSVHSIAKSALSKLAIREN